jgi:hypothetical protein
MSFNTKGFILAGTAIAIFGIGLYFWDNKDDGASNNYSQEKQIGGSRRQKKRHNKTHKKRR